MSLVQQVALDETQILSWIRSYLFQSGYEYASSSLQIEANLPLPLPHQSRQYHQLRNLVFSGCFSSIRDIVESNHDLDQDAKDELMYQITLQQYLELVDMEPETTENIILSLPSQPAHTQDEMMTRAITNATLLCLQVLQKLTSINEYADLVELLQHDSVAQHSKYTNWTKVKGRNDLLIKLCNELDISRGDSSNEVEDESQEFIALLARGVLHREQNRDSAPPPVTVTRGSRNSQTSASSASSALTQRSSRQSEVLRNAKRTAQSHLRRPRPRASQNPDPPADNSEDEVSRPPQYPGHESDSKPQLTYSSLPSEYHDKKGASVRPAHVHAQQSSAKPPLPPRLICPMMGMVEDLQAVRCVAFHPSGSFVAVGANSQTLRVCAVNTSATSAKPNEPPPQLPVLFNTHPYHKGSIYSLEWSPNGRLLVSGSNDKTCRIMRYNVEQASGKVLTELKPGSATVRCTRFVSPTTLACGGAGQRKGSSIALFDLEKMEHLFDFEGHTDQITIMQSFNPNMLTSASLDFSVKSWDLRQASRGPWHFSMSAGVTSLTISKNQQFCLAGAENGHCSLYDIRAQKVMKTWQLHEKDIRFLHISPDQGFLLSASYEGHVKATALRPSPYEEWSSSILATHRDKVIQAHWHPHEPCFMSCSADKTAKLWSLPQTNQ